MNKFDKIMGILADFKTKFEATPQTFEQATLIDETTIVEFEALETGFPLFVVTDSGSIPAPEGTHALGGDYLGVTVTVDAEGIITEVVDERGSEENNGEFEAISADQLPAILEGVTEVIASELGIEMDIAYNVASAVVTKINEMTTTPIVEEQMSAEKIEAIVNGKLESFTAVLEGVAEMMNAISENNKTLNQNIASLKADFESFKAQPSEVAKESEKFARVGNLTAKQLFLKNFKNI